ncbi:EpsG family protein [Sphingomonas sp. Leaf33]|uniref:EpsG family protein n=1 Tax=Sphingomonas sp. Leaf33 TaxID=1736215 RepID=UPI001F35E5B8|nr:EpsG family protein [Sphingomonas sp. Leaf33]
MLGAIHFSRRQSRPYDSLFYSLAVLATTLMIGLRYEVGGDWVNYLEFYDAVLFQPLSYALTQTDPAYGLLNWASARLNFGLWFVDLGCAIFFMIGVARLSSRQPNPWLSNLIAVPYLVIVVGMGFTRQAAAIGILCWALADIRRDRILFPILLVGLAALFHKTAILFLPILLVPVFSSNFVLTIPGIIGFVFLFNLFLGSSSDHLITTYATGNYDSQGAGIRVAMNVLAAIAFVAFRDKMGFDKFSRSLWMTLTVLAFFSVVALFVLPSSSGIDRISMFIIPLQIVVLSRLPYALSVNSRPVPSVLLGVILYSASVQFVWLNFADNGWAWKPYQSIITSDQTIG